MSESGEDAYVEWAEDDVVEGEPELAPQAEDETLYDGDDDPLPSTRVINVSRDIDAGLVGAPETPPPATEFHWQTRPDLAPTISPPRTDTNITEHISPEAAVGDVRPPAPPPAETSVIDETGETALDQPEAHIQQEDTTPPDASVSETVDTTERPETRLSPEQTPHTMQDEAESAQPSMRLKPCKAVLGQLAVETADEVTARALEQDKPVEDEKIAEPVTQLRERIADIRAGIEQSEEGRLSDFAYMMREKKWPPSLTGILDANAPEGGWPRKMALLDKLVATDDEGQPIVSDLALLNIAQWHNHRHRKFEQKLEEEILPKQVAKMKALFEQAVEIEWFPPKAIDRLRAVHKYTKIVADDGQDTVLSNLGGYFLPFTDTMYLDSPDKEKSFVHESLHAAARNRDAEGNGIPALSSLHGIFSGWEGYRILSEAIVEHCVQSLTNESKSIFDTSVDPGIYDAERSLLDTLCRYGNQPIDVRRFVAALFETEQEREQLGEQSAHAQLKRAIAQAFPTYNLLPNTTGDTKDESALKELERKLRVRKIRRPWAQAYEESFAFAA
jgi:hypothetical protein